MRYPFQPVPKPSGGANTYIVKSTPTMGKGVVFVTQDIKMEGHHFRRASLDHCTARYQPPMSGDVEMSCEIEKFLGGRHVQDIFI